MGMQGGFTKNCCFLCLWDSRATAEHYVKRDWPARGLHISGIANIQSVPLVELKNVLMPPLYIKLGLMKNFLKALGRAIPMGLHFFTRNFPK